MKSQFKVRLKLKLNLSCERFSTSAFDTRSKLCRRRIMAITGKLMRLVLPFSLRLDSKKWKFIYAMVKNAKRHEAITSCDTISLRLLTPPLLRTQKANEVFLPPSRALIFNLIPRGKFSEKTALLSFGFQRDCSEHFSRNYGAQVDV